MALADLTKNYDYARLIEEEKHEFDTIALTDDLKVASTPAWPYYWRRVPALQNAAFTDVARFLAERFARLGRPLRMLSLASGPCGMDLELARGMKMPYRLTCTDINGALFDRARVAVQTEGLSIDFVEVDLNFMTIEPRAYDFIYGYAAVHHVINLEALFDQVLSGLAPGGLFHMVEVIGVNQRLIWPENERFANALLSAFPHIFGDAKIFVHDTYPGMEGVRQADIMGVLEQSFTPVFEHRHGAFIRYITTDSRFAEALDPSVEERRRVLDFLIDTDACAVQHGLLRPLEVWGIYEPKRQ